MVMEIENNMHMVIVLSEHLNVLLYVFYLGEYITIILLGQVTTNR